MKISESFREGLRRLHSAKRVILWVYLLNLVIAAAPAAVLSDLIRQSTKHSLAAENLRTGFDDEWYREFHAEASGLGETFEPSMSELGAVLNGLDAFVSGEMFKEFSGIVGIGLLFLLLWTFLTGGALHLYVEKGEVSREAFFAGAARFFPRLFRLMLLAGVFYAIVYWLLLPGVDHAIQNVNRQTIDERVAFAWVIAKYGLVLGAVLLINLIFDYAKILAVRHDRTGAFVNAWEGLRMVLRHPVKTVGLYLLVGAIGLAFLLLYGLVVPGAGQEGYGGVAWAFLLGQAYVVSRIWTRLLFFSSQSALADALSPRSGPLATV